jgi:hypothetical protein
VDTWSELLLAWLEGEGERQKRQTPLPPRVGDPAVRGWVHVGVGVLGGTLAAGLFVCWLVRMGAGCPHGPAEFWGGPDRDPGGCSRGENRLGR